MGFFNNPLEAITGKNQQKGNNVVLTQTGRKRLEDLDTHGMEYRVLSAINRRAPCDIGVVLKDPEINLSIAQVRDLMTRFYDRGWITEG